MPEVNDPPPIRFWRFQPHHSHHEFGNWNYAVLFLINFCCHVTSVLYKLKHLSMSQLHLLLRRKLKQWKKIVCAPGNWHFTSTSPYYIASKEGQPLRSYQMRAILVWHEQYTWSAMIKRAGTSWQASQSPHIRHHCFTLEELSPSHMCQYGHLLAKHSILTSLMNFYFSLCKSQIFFHTEFTFFPLFI